MHEADTGRTPVPGTGVGPRASTNARRRSPRQFGTIRKLPSGRFQASYLGPDRQRHTAPATFRTKGDADAWLSDQRTALDRGAWRDPRAGTETFGAYAQRWLAERDLKARTREDYQRILDAHLIPRFGTTPMRAITPTMVRSWFAGLDKTTPTMRAHCYGLLRTILRAAVAEDVISASPARIPGAGSVKRKITIRPATLPELEAIAEAMPARLQMMVLLAAWLGLRFGELAELRRADVDLAHQVVRVRRGVVRVAGATIVDTPKSAAGIRTVAIPPHLIEALRAHLARHTGPGRDALLFPGEHGGHLAPASLYGRAAVRGKDGTITRAGWGFYGAREAAGRPDLRFHDLRHTGATLAAATGATLAELMARLGHSTPGAAMRYQHAAADRDRAIAEALSEFASAKVVQLRPRQDASA